MNSREGIHWVRAEALARHEQRVFVQRELQSRQKADRAARHRLFDVPLHWMSDCGHRSRRSWRTPGARR